MFVMFCLSWLVGVNFRVAVLMPFLWNANASYDQINIANEGCDAQINNGNTVISQFQK